MRKEKLIREIHRAFPEMPKPKSENLVVGNSGESLEIKSAFMGQSWNSLAKEVLIQRQSAIAFFTKEAFHYYIPAFMKAVIENIEESGNLPTSLVRQLTLPLEIDTARLLYFNAEREEGKIEIEEFLLNELRESTKIAHFFIDRASMFSADQGGCVRSFLATLNEYYPEYFANAEPLIAIERYWFQYPEPA